MASWAKMASNLDSHPKIRRAGRDGGEVFLFVLRRNAELDLGGLIPKIHLEPWYVAYELMCDEVTARNGLALCVTAGLLAETETCFVISGWDDVWAKRPMTPAERQERFREKSKALLEDKPDTEPEVTKSNGAVVTERDSNVLEERRGEERERQTGTKPKRNARGISSPLPSDWTPTSEHIELARSRGLDVANEAAKFKAHAEANDRR